jgi:hypothetical protein
VVVDSRGRPVAGAQVVDRATGVHVTTGGDGSFCLEGGAGAREITVMAVGFQPAWRTLAAGERPQIALQSVPVLGEGGLAVAPTREGRVESDRMQALQGRRPADALVGLPTFETTLTRNAARLDALAGQVGTAPAWDSAAAEWSRVLESIVPGPAEIEIRYRAAHARIMAWRAGATPKRAAAAGTALDSFLGRAPKGAERDSAQRWLGELRR